MGRIFVEYVEGRPYRCRHCHCHLATANDLLSKQFHSKNGRAYLFNRVVNVSFGSEEERLMTTGMHIVRDAYCIGCMLQVGWKYVCAYEHGQKYKEGKVILERAKLEAESPPQEPISPSQGMQYSELDRICP